LVEDLIDSGAMEQAKLLRIMKGLMVIAGNNKALERQSYPVQVQSVPFIPPQTALK
jgi:hypothetical protein